MIENLENESALKTEGEALMLLVRRSGMKGVEAARALGIKPESLSRMKKFPKLSDGIKLKICQLFSLPLSYFTDDSDARPTMPDQIKALQTENRLLRLELDHMRKLIVEKDLQFEEMAEQLKQAGLFDNPD